jgi:hypothetical protein
MSNINDPEFKNQCGIQNQIQVGNIDPLLVVYPSIKPDLILFKDIDKKDQTLIVLAALYYNAPVTLYLINSNEHSTEELNKGGLLDNKGGDANIIAPPVSNMARVMDTSKH